MIAPVPVILRELADEVERLTPPRPQIPPTHPTPEPWPDLAGKLDLAKYADLFAWLDRQRGLATTTP